MPPSPLRAKYKTAPSGAVRLQDQNNIPRQDAGVSASCVNVYVIFMVFSAVFSTV